MLTKKALIELFDATEAFLNKPYLALDLAKDGFYLKQFKITRINKHSRKINACLEYYESGEQQNRIYIQEV
jgi:serine/threonine protein kinase HipA of HipAB toxin-antitoxin module